MDEIHWQRKKSHQSLPDGRRSILQKFPGTSLYEKIKFMLSYEINYDKNARIQAANFRYHPMSIFIMMNNMKSIKISVRRAFFASSIFILQQYSFSIKLMIFYTWSSHHGKNWRFCKKCKVWRGPFSIQFPINSDEKWKKFFFSKFSFRSNEYFLPLSSTINQFMLRRIFMRTRAHENFSFSLIAKAEDYLEAILANYWWI